MGSKLNVVIQKPLKGCRYTDGDRVRGTVHLSVLSSLSLKTIVIVLKCVATSQVMVVRNSPNIGTPGIGNMMNGMAALGSSGRPVHQLETDSHVLIDQSVEVFPPPEIRQIMETKSFTLTAGKYEYPFDFVLPTGVALADQRETSSGHMALGSWCEDAAGANGWTSLPPSMNDHGRFANVAYYVHATAKRSAMLKMNLHSLENFDFVPRINIQPTPHYSAAVSDQIAGGRKRREKLPVMFEVRFPNPPYIITGRGPCFRLFVVFMHDAALYQAPPIYVQSIKLSMIETIIALVPVEQFLLSTRQHEMREVNSVIADQKYDNLEFECTKNPHQEIPLQHYADFVVPEIVVPSFAIRNIVKRHRFKFTIGVSLERLSSPPEKRELRKQVQYVTIDCPNVQVIAGGLDNPDPVHEKLAEAPPYINGGQSIALEKVPVPAYST